MFKIAQIVSTFPPYMGGMGNVAYQYSMALQKAGNSVSVFTPQIRKFQPHTTESSLFHIHRLRSILSYGNAAFLPQLAWKLSEFDVVHLHYPFFGSTEAILLAKKFFKHLKLITTYHMDVFSDNCMVNVFVKYSNKFILPKIIEASSKVIITSYDYNESGFLGKFIKQKPSKFVEIPLGVDIHKFKLASKSEKLLEKYKLDAFTKIILFVGALDAAHSFKGVPVLLSAFKKLNKYKLLIVGGGDKLSEYKKLAVSLGISESSIIFAGKIDGYDLPGYYNLADVLVLPSTSSGEAFGMVLLEAMSCGTPVIASNLRGVRSIVSDQANGLLANPGDAVDLASKLNSLLEDDSALEAYKINARKIVEQKYSLGRVSGLLKDVYNQI